MDKGDAALKVVEDELRRLKHALGSAVRIRKNPGTDPFPVAVTLTQNATEEASHFDFTSMQLRLAVPREVASRSGQAALLQSLAVASDDLPRQLTATIAGSLRAAWHEHLQRNSSAALGLAFLADHLRRNLPVLLALEPHLLDAYQGVDETGGTARRFAFVLTEPDNDSATTGSGAERVDPSVSGRVDSSPPSQAERSQPGRQQEPLGQAAPTSNGSPSSCSATDARDMTQGGSAAVDAQPTSAGDASRSYIESLPWPLKKELSRVYARFPLGFQSPAASEPPALQSRHDAGRFGQPDDGEGATCTVQLTPSDPEWRHGVITLWTRVTLSAKKAASAQTVSPSAAGTETTSNAGERRRVAVPKPLAPGAASLRAAAALVPCDTLEAAVCVMVDKMLQREAERLAGAPSPLYQLLKHVETHAAAWIHSAWDVMLEYRPESVVEATTSAKRAVASAKAVAEAAADAGSDPHAVAGRAKAAALRPRSPTESADAESDAEGHAGAGGSDVEDSDVGDSDSTSWSGADSESGNSSDGRRHSVGGGLGGGGGETGDGIASVAVRLEGLLLDNIDCLELLRVGVQVKCSRCGTNATVQFSSDSPRVGSGRWVQGSATCGTCSQALVLELQAHLVHGNSNLLAHVRPRECRVECVDLLPAWYGAQCGDCGSIAALRDVQVGSYAGRNCGKCFKTMQVRYSAASFAQAQSSLARAKQPAASTTTESGVVALASQQAARRCKHLQDTVDALKLGQPLPDLGRCRHYHHSHRWLRFPCCGMRFPCDLCHEELTDGHEMKWAKRMICGYCSLEQPVGQRCAHCDKKLAATARNPEGRNTHFWEGGKGCRDKRFLDRRDKHKWSNSAAKTKSKRAAQAETTRGRS